MIKLFNNKYMLIYKEEDKACQGPFSTSLMKNNTGFWKTSNNW